MAKLAPMFEAPVHVQASACDEEDCAALTWRFNACTLGHAPMRSHGADRVRYDLPVGKTLQAKMLAAFPGMKGVVPVGHIYRTRGLVSALDRHSYGPVHVTTDWPEAGASAADALTTTQSILVFLSSATGSCFFFGEHDDVQVGAVQGTMVRFQHHVPFRCSALLPSDDALYVMVLRGW
jgi:hypothetical protein